MEKLPGAVWFDPCIRPSRNSSSQAGIHPAKPELLILAADCDDAGLVIPTGFLKSRVYAKLLRRLISKRYQTFNGQVKEGLAGPYDSEDYKIGKPINSYAVRDAVSR